VLLATREQPYNQLTDLGGLFSGPRYVVAIPIVPQKGACLGFVLVARDADKMLGEWTSMLSIAAIIAMGVFLAAMLFTLFYTRRMARPLDEMAAASRKFAKGDFSPRVEQTADPTDEMGMLIESFNKMADSLEQAEKRRSEFIANISHELRTPMTTISGFADGILDGTIPREKQAQYLETISSETKRLNRLVRSMLELSRIQSGSPAELRAKSFDAAELLRG
jgi:signal transduction histidine kinase